MDVLFLAGTAGSSTVPAPCAAWPNLISTGGPVNRRLSGATKRDLAWSAADARKGIRVLPSTIRGGITFVPDPLALTMTPPPFGAGGTSLFR